MTIDDDVLNRVIEELGWMTRPAATIDTPDKLKAEIGRVLERLGVPFTRDESLYLEGYDMGFDYVLPTLLTRFKVWDRQSPAFSLPQFQAYREILTDKHNYDLDYFCWDGVPRTPAEVEETVRKVLAYRRSTLDLHRSLKEQQQE